jgi:protein-disulfide isomerase
MPPKVKRDIGLIIAIVFASMVVSGSLVFASMTLFGGNISGAAMEKEIEKGIENFVKKKENEAIERQAQAAVVEAKQNQDKARLVAEVTDADHVYGSRDAKITMVEYSDFQCPYCFRFHNIAKSIVDNSNGTVSWIYRHYPLGFHDPAATQQAIASECVAEIGGNEKFWEYAVLLFGTGDDDADSLGELAGQIGVDKTRVSNCISSGKYLADVKSDFANGEDIGIRGTPGTVLLNLETGDAMLIEGAQPEAVFEKAINEMLVN